MTQQMEPEVAMVNEVVKEQPFKDGVETTWFFDTGGSNHMSGDKFCFQELDTSITGRVKFGDGSIIEICGRGSILFKCKNEEHLILSEVYYIPKLKSNILSLGQLDENGCKIIIEGGFMKDYDRLKNLIAKVEKQSNRLYMGKF